MKKEKSSYMHSQWAFVKSVNVKLQHLIFRAINYVKSVVKHIIVVENAVVILKNK